MISNYKSVNTSAKPTRFTLMRCIPEGRTVLTSARGPSKLSHVNGPDVACWPGFECPTGTRSPANLGLWRARMGLEDAAYLHCSFDQKKGGATHHLYLRDCTDTNYLHCDPNVDWLPTIVGSHPLVILSGFEEGP